MEQIYKVYGEERIAIFSGSLEDVTAFLSAREDEHGDSYLHKVTCPDGTKEWGNDFLDMHL